MKKLLSVTAFNFLLVFGLSAQDTVIVQKEDLMLTYMIIIAMVLLVASIYTILKVYDLMVKMQENKIAEQHHL